MPGNLMRYSGLITKTRAMGSNLLTEEELHQLTELATVDEVIGFLKETKGYGTVFREKDGVWHRGQAEAVIVNSLYQDFEKLYRFADEEQRTALHYVMFRYETDILKLCFQGLYQKKGTKRYIHVDPFFCKHACFPVERVKQASDLSDFVQALSGTPYEKVFGQATNAFGNVYADYAARLDIFYYTSVFKEIRQMKSSGLKEILQNICGTKIDWLNIMWIYRSKRFYHQTEAELTADTIPFTYLLKKEELHGLIAASDLEEMNRILEKTGYFKGKDAFVQMENEISYQKIIRTMHQRVSRKYPVSIAPVLKYLYEKEQEIDRLTTIIEGIRYQIPPAEIKDLILITI